MNRLHALLVNMGFAVSDYTYTAPKETAINHSLPRESDFNRLSQKGRRKRARWVGKRA